MNFTFIIIIIKFFISKKLKVGKEGLSPPYKSKKIDLLLKINGASIIL